MATSKSSKRCAKCGVDKPLTEYHKHGKGLRPRCKPCHIADVSEWTSKNHSAYIARIRRWYDENKRSPRVLLSEEEKKRRKIAVNRAWAAKNAERFKEIRRSWSARNKHVEMERVRRRQAAQRKATPKWASIPKMREFYRAALEKTKETGVKWSVDHIVPLISEVVCGLHVEHNMQILPFSDNVRKGNRVWPDMP